MPRKNCAYCNKEFYTRPQGQHARFCSDTCRKASHKAEKQNETKLTLQFGKFTVTIVNLDPASDKESLRRTVVEALGPELIAQASALQPIHQVDEA
jgi:predicted nucleic acid-binding Zn ribbon protein